MRVLLIDLNPFMPPVTPISLGNLAAVLDEMGHQPQVLSIGSTSRFSPRGLARVIEDFSPSLVGFGAYQRNIHHVRAAARMIKQISPAIGVVIGGPQATFLPDAGLAAMEEIDFVSRGEGELTIRALVEAIEGGCEQAPIAGITSRGQDGEIVTGPPIEPPRDLDGYPSPWLKGILDPGALPESIMLTSRGCCNSCAFCYTPAAFGGRIRCQSVERAVEDIAHVVALGSGRLWFADPNFSFSEGRLVTILEELVRRDVVGSLWVETRADMVSPELLELMRRAGVRCLAMGLESASPNVYPLLQKDLDPDVIRRAVGMAHRAGMEVELFSQYALPGERLDDAMQTLSFVKSCGVEIRGNSNAQQMQLYFGSEIYENHERYGVRPLRETSPPYMAIGTQFETDWMSAEEIAQIKSSWRTESADGGKRVVS